MASQYPSLRHPTAFFCARRATQPTRHRARGYRLRLASLGTAVAAVVLVGATWTSAASAATPVQLGAATPFAVLGGSEVTDVPTSSITGDVGLSPATGADITGLTQAEVDGTIYTTDGTGPADNVNDPALLTLAQTNRTAAYVQAAGEPPTTTYTTGDNQLGGQTLVPGVYAFGAATTANIGGATPLILNGEGNVNAVFVFQASSSLITASGSVVMLEGGAQACNVYWDVGSSATLGSSSTFVGTINAVTSDFLDSGATVQGRVLAGSAVTLDANTITAPTTCNTTSPTTTTTTTTASGTGGTGGTGGTSGTGSTTGSGAAAGTAAAGTNAATGTAGTTSAAGTNSAGTTGTDTSAVVPTGFPHTGLGGAAHSRDDDLIGLGVLGLVASAGALAVAVRRRWWPTMAGTRGERV